MKKIFNLGLVLALASSALFTTSCEDMFTAENTLVTTNLAPQDTLYNVIGIVQRMQNLATRTILFGEVRADLVDINDVTPSSIKEISENNVSLENEYNSPADYYAVINSCNIYLANVDSLLKTHGEVYYEKEVAAVKTFRAWSYLELAKIYGTVPFITEPITAASQAEEEALSSTNRKGLEDICTYFIEDLAKYPYMDENLDLRPSYGTKTFGGASFANFFIPVRLMLAELYLWRGSATQNKQDFIEAVRLYHDFLTFTGETHPTGYNYDVTWNSRQFVSNTDNYATGKRFTTQNLSLATADYIAYIPVDTLEFEGNVSELRSIFCSSYKNDYYAYVNPSAGLKELSAAQMYCYYDYVNVQTQDTLYAPRDERELKSVLEIGDLRLQAVYSTNTVNDKYHSYNKERQYILKYTDGKKSLSNDERLSYIPLYRYTMVYLHMAEALCRAGFPYTAFAVLKYGITEDVLQNRNIIPQEEYDALAEIKTRGFSPGGTDSFVEWDNTKFISYDPANTGGTTPTQVGIHSLGSGYSPANAYYQIPRDSAIWADYDKTADEAAIYSADAAQWLLDNALTIASTHEDSVAYNEKVEEISAKVQQYNDELLELDSIAMENMKPIATEYVSKAILDEEALEGMFEGYRFYDLMRYAMYYQQPNFISEQVAKRGSSASSSAANLAGGKWYLPLRSR